MFSALKQGDLIYILEKEDGLKISIGTVSSTPRPRYNIGDAKTGMGITVIDIDVKTPEQEFKFEGISPSQSITDYGNAVISDSREAMITKVDALCNESSKILRDMEVYRKIADSRNDVIKVLNPAFAKEAERDEAIVNLTARLDSFEKRFGSSLSNIESLLAKAENKKNH